MNDVTMERKLHTLNELQRDVRRLMSKGGLGAYYRDQVIGRFLHFAMSSEVGYLTQTQIDTRLMLFDIEDAKKLANPEKAVLKDIAALRAKVRNSAALKTK